ncbi:RNA polymerase sigma factor (sigma-70 family) [Lachnospiraceae bacterium PM6-15]|uniref:sigma-70 family RNA polymerase sigma factor n=1 Tax=Ohessyouella blattaphilus TaxID=2949333 RepID=UPI003E310144
MDEKHPKRRRDKYNPYHIRKSEGRYYLEFKDGTGELHKMEVDKTMFEAFDRFELDDISFFNKWDKHIEHSELTEASINQRAFIKESLVEDIVLDNTDKERLHKAVSSLPSIQRRRLIMYFFEEMTFEEIALLEGCTKMPVKRSIDSAIANLRKKLL